MYKEFVHTSRHMQGSQLHEFNERDRHQDQAKEARQVHLGLRRSLGLRLISLGERLADETSELETFDKAA